MKVIKFSLFSLLGSIPFSFKPVVPDIILHYLCLLFPLGDSEVIQVLQPNIYINIYEITPP